MKMILNIGLGVMLFDLVAFVAWSMSGQLPVDSFYFGFITKFVIGLFI